jgi:hypothetical protein
MEETFRAQNFLKLAEERLEEQHQAFLSLDQKAWQNISVGSIILGFFAALNLQSFFVDRASIDLKWYDFIFLVGALIAYILSFYWALWSRMPITFESPIEMSWEKASWALNDHDDEQYFAMLISSYVDAVTANNEKINSKAVCICRSTICLGVTVAMLVVAAIVLAL